MSIDRVPGLNKEFSSASPQQVLAHVIESYSGRVTLASSLGAEDQVITHMVAQITDALDIFVLDTGRLHQETYNLMETTSRQYAFNYRVFFPQSDAVSQWLLPMARTIFTPVLKTENNAVQLERLSRWGGP
jgi:phosphoadenosine phosphosulfate reductase